MHVRIASYACQNFISSTRCTPLRGFSRRHRRSATLTHTHIYALNSNKAFNARTHARIHRVLSSKYRNRAPLLSYAIARLNYKLTLRVTIIITDLKIDTIYKTIKATTTTIRTTRILISSARITYRKTCISRKKTASFEPIKSFAPTTPYSPYTGSVCPITACYSALLARKCLPPLLEAVGLGRSTVLTCTREGRSYEE